MDINLDQLLLYYDEEDGDDRKDDDPNEYWNVDRERPTFNLIKATLEYPATVELKGKKLAEDIAFSCQTMFGLDACHFVWDLLLRIVRLIPADHPWQESLLGAFSNLHDREGSVGQPEQGKIPVPWAELPGLSLCIREAWNFVDLFIDDDTEEQKLAVGYVDVHNKWKNLNSFLARMTEQKTNNNPIYSIWILRQTLEENHMVSERELWAATEWIIHCAPIYFEKMSWKGPLNENSRKAYSGGPLLGSKPPLSLERWDFWKSRLQEHATQAEELKLEKSIVNRISVALKKMEEEEERSKGPESKENWKKTLSVDPIEKFLPSTK